MKIYQIWEKASEEKNKEYWIETYFKDINKFIEKYPNGIDYIIPKDIQDGVESKCDMLGIPAYSVLPGILSIAKTYKALEKRERER